MIFILLFFFQVSSISNFGHWYNTTFCVCEDRKDINCSDGCKNFRTIGYNYKEILKVTRKFNEPHITFLIYGTTDSRKPEFYLNEYINLSLNIVSATTHKENIILNGITKSDESYNLDYDKFFPNASNQDISDEIYSHFSNLNIYFLKGKYIFNHLILYKSFLLPYSDSALTRKTAIFQNFLTTDFTSFSNIPSQIKHINSKYRIQIHCNESVNHVYFLEDHQILLQADSSLQQKNKNNTIFNKTDAIIDLRNLKKNIRANIILVSRNLKLTFQYMPKNEDEIPKIDFKLKKSAKILIDTANQTFNDKLMKIDNINFIHGTSSLYFYSSNKKVPIPTFSEDGVGTVYKNNEVSVFYSSYCICEGDDCQTKCGVSKDHIIPYDIKSLDKTVIGNPMSTLKYVIANSSPKKGRHPTFDLEHFGDKSLTVVGATKDEHIEFVGDASDDVGVFSFTNLCFHGSHLSFPEVSLHDVRVAKEKRKGGVVLNSTLLKSDVSTLKNFFMSNVSISEPWNGYEIHTTNILNQVSLTVLSSTTVRIDNSLTLPLLRTSTMKIFGSGIVNIFLGSKDAPKKVSSFPSLRIYLEGDRNVVTFPMKKWPEALKDLSSKLTLVHGENDVYVNGDTKYGKDTQNPVYRSVPPTVDHEGTGAFFINGRLCNYADKFCICETDSSEISCEYLCQDYGSVVGFSSEEIEAKTIGNPIRNIQYFIVNSSKSRHPRFDLMKFSEKSFSVTGLGDDRQFVSLVGTFSTTFASSSVSHVFQNVEIEFESAGFYFFNSVEFSNCTFITKVNLSDGSHQAIEFKKNAIRIYHFGLTIDMTSLRSIYAISPHLIYPSKNFLRIDGGSDLKGFTIENSRFIILDDRENESPNINSIRLDVSMLFSPVQLSSDYGDSIERPFTIRMNEETIQHVDDLPTIFLDLQSVPSEDAFLMFEGRKTWQDEWHNLTNKITVFYGLINIHLMTKILNPKKELFSGLPPHVALVGDGEYYINNEKQGSVFAPGNIVNSDNDDADDEEGRRIWLWILICILIMGSLVGFAFFYSGPSRKRSLSFFDRWRDNGRRKFSESDISLNHFEIDLDDVTLSD